MHSKGFTLPTEAETPSRGIFFLVLGLGGADADYQVLFDEVSRRGWRIVLIPTGSMSYVPDAPFAIDSDVPESIDHAAADLGDFVDQRLGELAYAVEGATDYLSRTHPELAGKPVVVFGYSGGAIAAPAIAARLKHTMPGRLAALVAVCGGSNLVGIAQHSIVIDFDRFVHWSNGAGWSGNDRLSDAYLRHTRLDPAVIGRSLWDVPTLMVKARVDWAIPGSAANQLYDDLGRPERWTYLAGHESVLERLASDRVRFADWLDTTVAKRAAH